MQGNLRGMSAMRPAHPPTYAPPWRKALAFAAIYLIWGSTYLAIRFAIETLPPFSMGAVRFTVAGAILYVGPASAPFVTA